MNTLIRMWVYYTYMETLALEVMFLIVVWFGSLTVLMYWAGQ